MPPYSHSLLFSICFFNDHKIHISLFPVRFKVMFFFLFSTFATVLIGRYDVGSERFHLPPAMHIMLVRQAWLDGLPADSAATQW